MVARPLVSSESAGVVVRTRPSGFQIERATFDWLASYWFRDNEAIAKLFESSHEQYNRVVDQLRTGGNGTATWAEIAPRQQFGITIGYEF